VNLFKRLVRRLLRRAGREPSRTAQERQAYADELEHRIRSMRDRTARANLPTGVLDQAFKAWGHAGERWGSPRKDQRP
jgi:hypothetical protein